MATYYKCNTSQNRISSSQGGLCTLCVTTQSYASACTSSRSSNSTKNEKPCSVYCNTGTCNSICNTAQTLCRLGVQFIKNHADVGAFPGEEIQKDDFIHEKWTTKFFSDLNEKLTTAERVGLSVSQGSNGSFTNPKTNDVMTAQLYNDIETKLEGFVGGKYNKVAVDQLITATVANAIRNAYNNAKFSLDVCDVCNSAEHVGGICNCNCSCSCSCNCGCSCPCSCSCSCSCNCSCGPSCECNDPKED